MIPFRSLTWSFSEALDVSGNTITCAQLVSKTVGPLHREGDL